MRRFQHLTDEQLSDALEPKTWRLNRLADLYEIDDFGSRTLSEIEAEAVSIVGDMLEYLKEFGYRYPHDSQLQQNLRDTFLMFSRLRGRERMMPP